MLDEYKTSLALVIMENEIDNTGCMMPIVYVIR